MTELEQLSLGVLDDLAPSAQRIATCVYGPSVHARPGTYPGYDLLIISEEYPSGLRAHKRMISNCEMRFLVVERSLIESDIRKGTLGDFLTERFLYPFKPLSNYEYVENLAQDAKVRVVKEEVKDLVLEYGEMCRGLVAKPEFFGLSKMRKRARVFIPSLDEYLRLLDPSVREKNITTLRRSFRDAILKVGSDVLELDDENVTISDIAVDRWLRRRTSEQVVNILKQSQRVFYSYVTTGRAIYPNLELFARELYSPVRLRLAQELEGLEPEDPKNYLYLKTAERLVSLNERSSLEETVSKLRPGRPITVSPLGGVLNEVFLVTIGRERFVAKRFTDWHGFKWFTLNLVSLGSKLFAVSGKTRMSNEYGINRYLAKKGLEVPQIVHVSVKDRILLEGYISGTTLANFAKRAANSNGLTPSEHSLAETFGETVARIHEVGVSIGDSKPENFVAKNHEIYTVDLEQAGKRGDYAWDIAELLFYSAHYSNTPTPSKGLGDMVEDFISGYLKNGNGAELRRAAGLRYSKAFSLWTPAPIIFEITKKLRESA